jgi:Zn-dependent protease with chaperone function
MALLAHEVGHHLNGHTLRRGGSKPALELEADEFAGYILGQLGATLQQSQNVMNYIAKDEASSTHPSRSSRMLAIEKGWDKAAVAENLAALNDQ